MVADDLPERMAATQQAATQHRSVVEVPPTASPPVSWWRRPSIIVPVAAGVVAVAVVSGLVIAQGGEKDSDASTPPATRSTWKHSGKSRSTYRSPGSRPRSPRARRVLRRTR